MAGVAPPTDGSLAPGTRIAHYEIQDILGRGGMGRVYKARDLNLGRTVALKSPLAELTEDDRERKRFLREARAASSLSHPNTVQVYEVFDEGNLPWIAMEFIEGETLRDRFAGKKPLAMDQALELAIGVAEGLQAAHERRILHRDLTPRNILIDRSGRAKITDFGLARMFVPPGERSSASTQSSQATRTGAVVGTAGYMSPEQALGRPVDPRSDIFSLGAVLYEMCTGCPAFPSTSRGDALDAVLHREPKAIAALNYEAPEELIRMVRKCLAKRPEERYQDCTDLLVDLRALRRARASGISEAALRPAPRPSRRLVPLALAGAGTAVAAAILLTQWSGDRPALKLGTPRQVTSTPVWEGEPAISPDGEFVAYASEESGNADIWIVDAGGGTPLRASTSPAADRDPSWLPDGSALVFVSDRTGSDAIWKIPKFGGAPVLLVPNGLDPAVSPDGKRIAFARPGPSADLRIAVAPLDDVARAEILTGNDDGLWDHLGPAWSPDGKRICYAAFRDLWLISLDGQPPRRLTTDGEMDRDPVWSSDGAFVYFSSYREGTLALWRVPAGGGTPERVTLGSGPESHPSVSADGRRLAYTTLVQDPDLVIRDMKTGEERMIPGSRLDASPSLLPDGTGFVFASDRWAGRWDLWFQGVSGAIPVGAPRRITDHAGSAQHPAVSPDGRWIAYWGVLEDQRDVWITPAGGGPPRKITSDPAPDFHPAWSPDGRYLAFASERDGTSRIWRVEIEEGVPRGTPEPVTTGQTSDMAPAWSPDGASIAFIGKSGDENDVWVVEAGDPSSARQVTRGASAWRARWDATEGDLLVSGLWGGDRTHLRRVDPATGASEPLDPPVFFGQEAIYIDFDLSRDARTLVYSRARSRGDIWILESEEGAF